MHGDDLVADRETDTGAAGLGAALVKFLLDQRDLVLRDAGAVVPDGDDDGDIGTADGRIDDLALAAVLGRVVQDVQDGVAKCWT